MAHVLVTKYSMCVPTHASWPYLCVNDQFCTLFPLLHFLAGVLYSCSSIWPSQGCRCIPCLFSQLTWTIHLHFSRDGLLLHWEHGILPKNWIVLRSIIRTVVSHCRSPKVPWLLLTQDGFSSQHLFEVVITLSKRVRIDGWLGLGWLLFQGDVPHH